MTSPRLLTVVLCAATLLGAVGCATKNPEAVRTDLSGGGRTAPTAPVTPPPAATTTLQHDDGAEGLDAAPLYYSLDSATLTDDSQERLRTLAAFLRRHPEQGVRISGHTCDLGTSEYNLALGQKRAHAARDYLVALGVNPERVNALTLGEERPAEDGENEASRQRNRRSELDLRVTDSQASR